MESRRDNILQMIRKKGQVSITELKQAFSDVSEMTIRRDIEMLDQEKLIVRVHGGAKSIESVVSCIEDRYTMRSLENAKLKTEIAQKAVTLIKPHTCVFLDSGSTTTALAHVFPDVDCMVYTTGLTCAMELVRLKNVKIVMSGGWVNPNSLSTYGSNDISSLARTNFDQAFLGVTGYTPDAGFTTGLYDEGELKRTVIRRSQQRVVLMGSNKVGKVFPSTFAEPADIDIMISDDNLDAETADYFREKGVALL